MNLTIDVKVDRVRLRALEEAPGQVAAGQRRAINRAASRLRTQAVKRIGQRVFLKSSYLRERLELYRASTARGFATVIGRARATRLDRFPFRQHYAKGKNGKRKRAGIAVRILREGGAKTIRSAFLVPARRGTTAGAGGHAIAVRTSVLRAMGKNVDSGSLGGSGSREYEVLHGLSIAALLRREMESGLGDEITTYYAAQLEAEMKRAVARVRR